MMLRRRERGGKSACVLARAREIACVVRVREREREIVAFDQKLLPLSLHLPSSHSYPENASKSVGPTHQNILQLSNNLSACDL